MDDRRHSFFPEVSARIRETFAFFRAFAGPLVGISFLFSLPMIGLSLAAPHLLSDTDQPDRILLGLFLFSLVYTPVYRAGLILTIDDLAEGRDIVPASLLARAASAWPRMFPLQILGLAAVMLGLLALILPGLFILARISLAEYVLLFEKTSPVDSLKRSNTLARQLTSQILVTLLPLLALFYATDFWAAELLVESPLLSGVVYNALLLLFYALMTVLCYRFYGLARQSEPAR